MYNKVKAVLGSLLFGCIFLFCLGNCMDLLENKTARQKYEAFWESDTDFDVIFMGTSHIYNTVYPQELWKEYGLISYNWGYSNCTLAENYYILQDVLKHTTPRLIVLDMYGLLSYENGNGKYRPNRIEQQHVQFDSIPFSLNKYRASQDIFDDYSGNLDFIFNFIMYHNRWTELGKQDFEYTPPTQKGANWLVGIQKDLVFESPEAEEKMEIDTVCYQYMLKILEYCSENEIQLLCVYVPWCAGAKEQTAANSIEEVIESYDFCDYVNLLELDLLNWKTDLYDKGHVNYMGGCKVTSWLGKYILDNYNIPSRQDEEKFAAQWNSEYEEYVEFRQNGICSENELYYKLLRIFGQEFEAELLIADDCAAEREDELLQELIANLSDCLTVSHEEEVKYEGGEYDILLTIKRGDEIFDVKGYQYENIQNISYLYP